MNEFNEETIQNGLRDLISGEADTEEICWENLDVRTFEEAGTLTRDKGLVIVIVITLPDGSEYQITIIRSR